MQKIIKMGQNKKKRCKTGSTVTRCNSYHNRFFSKTNSLLGHK